MKTKTDAVHGGFSSPGKMPGLAWSISAKHCAVGSALRRLAREKGIPTPCGSCYALKGRYVFPGTVAAHARRLAAYTASPEGWAAGVVAGIREVSASRGPKKSAAAKHFRWFDAGDLQSVEMLAQIVAIARAVPDTSFWLPTQESGMVAAWLRDNPAGFPPNLCVRASDSRLDRPGQPVPAGVTRSRVGSATDTEGGYQCPAPSQGNTCGDCRACWDGDTPLTRYAAH